MSATTMSDGLLCLCDVGSHIVHLELAEDEVRSRLEAHLQDGCEQCSKVVDELAVVQLAEADVAAKPVHTELCATGNTLIADVDGEDLLVAISAHAASCQQCASFLGQSSWERPESISFG